MLVNVTQEDIDQGVPQSPTRCMLIRAIRRLPGFEKAIVAVYPTGGSVYVAVGEVVKIIRLPEEVAVQGNLFDAKLPVQPFSFELVM